MNKRKKLSRLNELIDFLIEMQESANFILEKDDFLGSLNAGINSLQDAAKALEEELEESNE